jgi:hypothetical protein
MLTKETVDITLDFKLSQDYTVFNAESFKALCEEHLPWTKGLPEGSPHRPPENAINLGGFRFFNAVYPFESAISGILRERPTMRRNWLEVEPKSRKRIGFSANVLIPLLQSPQGMPWMSFTPMEIRTQRSQIAKTKGKTVIAGMGLGWFAYQVLRRSKVTEVVIIDRNQDVLNYFGEKLKAVSDKPITLVHENAYDFDWKNANLDAAVWDIWSTYTCAGCDRKYLEIREELLAAGKTCTQWGTLSRA